MVQVIAHRGARSIAPENTLTAAKTAYESGADLWETDVSVTRDNQLVLFHDETLLRCTNAASRFPSRSSYRVRDFCLADIQSLDAGSYFMNTDPFLQVAQGKIPRDTLAAFKNETVPTLEQGVLFTRENKWRVNLELKQFFSEPFDTALPDRTLDTIYRTDIPLDQVIISSFHHDWLFRIMDKEPKIEVQALVGKNRMDSLDFGAWEFSTYNVHAGLIDPDQIRELKARGKKINLFTVNDPKDFLRFVDLGVDGIITDFPQLFARPFI
ncbi:glycerophosphodiester phosphodiesterase family protein [Desulfobacula sp.]|uniref:glycerophosphodiester phosphodiesterase n=1 Tax=Desulfobacula sp. TaxID=2593537 RepID=UPI002627CDB8|nr:glycerophosphodiester phosphodiesterase family protein [Desulfobacula sp.]